MDRWLVACTVMGLLTWTGTIAAGSKEPAASLTISGDPAQPAGAPVIVQIRVHNTGNTKISYWCSGPGEYPDAGDFVASVVGADGACKKIAILNGQRPEASGRSMEIAPGRSITFPVTPGILEPGSYRISIDGAEQAWDGASGRKVVTWPATHSADVYQLEVRHDNALAAARDARVISRVRSDDPFARFVAAKWPRRAVRKALVEDVSDDDIVAADRAADGLWGNEDPAKVDGPLVASLILKHLQPPADGCDIGLMTRLVGGNEPPDSDVVKSAMAKLVLSRPEGAVRRAASAALDRRDTTDRAARPFQLAGANSDLTGADETQRRAQDAAMVQAIFEMAESEDVHERKLAYTALADYPRNRAAITALLAAQTDPDSECRNVAENAYHEAMKKRSTTRP